MARTLVCTDLHGHYGLWNEIKKELKEDDFLFFLGDAADRGPNGLRIIVELLEMVEQEKCCYIKGNHEDMFDICMREYLDHEDWNLPWWFGNGGYSTYINAKKLSKEEIKFLVDKIHNLPQRVDYVSTEGNIIYLTHAGFSPGYTRDEALLKGRTKEDYLWDRKHFKDAWKGKDNEYVIHGHTPTSFMEHQDIPCIFKYDNNHKINLDIEAYFHNRAVLFNLETLEVEKYVESEEE